MSTLLTIKEVCAITKKGESTIRRLMAQRKISYVKIGGSVRFKATDVERTIQNNTVRAF